MSAKHQTPEYQRNAKIIKQQVRAQHRAGLPSVCWRGGGLIGPLVPFDVGHINGARGSALSDLAPEHRHRFPGCCEGNRRHGGRQGAAIAHRTTTSTVHNAGNVSSYPL